MSLQGTVLDPKGVNTFQQAAINLSSSASPGLPGPSWLLWWSQQTWSSRGLDGGGCTRHHLTRVRPSLAPSCVSCAECCSLGGRHREWFASPPPRGGGKQHFTPFRVLLPKASSLYPHHPSLGTPAIVNLLFLDCPELLMVPTCILLVTLLLLPPPCLANSCLFFRPCLKCRFLRSFPGTSLNQVARGPLKCSPKALVN